MFTINIYLRFALIALFLIGGFVLSLTISFWYALPILLIGLILLAGYILLGTVQSAAKMLQTADFLGAEKRLALTWKPALLYKANRAYYYMLRGTISSGLKRGNEETEKWLKLADDIGFQSDDEKAMVTLQLVGIAMQKGNWNFAKGQLKKLKKMDITQDELKEQIQQVQKAVKNRGAIRNARIQGRGQMQQGSKRRRPKMR
ncbi:MAG TPA: hypothetical protein VJ917_00725 [Saprospiraceae bacterium]|nr:hypothetical protein [Saprospiraceae bacterium]